MIVFKRPYLYITLGLLFILVPIVNIYLPIFSRGQMTILNMIVIYSIGAIGFNILLGYSGQVSLGHIAFMGLGAYLSAYITQVMDLSFILGLLVAGIIPMLLGLILGAIALRLEGHYLAIATLGLGMTIKHIFIEWTAFTEGFSGRRAPPAEIFGLEIIQREHSLILGTIVLVILAIFAYNLLNSKTGRALMAMRDSSHAAQAVGISMFKYKMIAFAISTFYVGIAGGLYAHLIRFIEPTRWGLEASLDLVAMTVIGGLASIGGSVVGAAFLEIVPNLARNLPVLEGIRSINFIITGILLILTIIYFPEGLYRKFVKWGKSGLAIIGVSYQSGTESAKSDNSFNSSKENQTSESKHEGPGG
ncbi:branched-chain amino acid ABC transporter permease [Natranaerobius thermophilus]|uniref:Inner-membrane translocator n=1 Tax=Natranaerobius thermophilus (strain ATCC BAA-1301 / DSM 18059 / JW/NM-WN-LF) TaxID=457570 RepID=B2A2S1_NATTJ|nr:branched-chain amino acid ABC transporter permease [Natranaerobius thermophilus]ACB86289.1 inner-membrane translocator [Natranaerobius thermophilus JW/NM-WN-LF]